MKSKYEQYVGQKFNRLTVLGVEKEYGTNHKSKFRCKCDCGKEILSDAYSILKGSSKSCGCYNLDNITKERGHSGLVKVYNVYRQNAKRRELPFELSLEKFKEMVTQNCSYCGSEPYSRGQGNYRKDSSQESIDHSKFTYSGVDRIDSDKGYIETNVVPCCKICNLAKHEMSQEQFKVWLNKACDFLNKK